MHVRPATAADREEISQIYLDSRKLTFNWINPSLFALSDFIRDTEGEDIFVAEESGKICGFISIWTPDRFIHHLFVSPSSTRKGVGAALLKQGLAHTGSPARLKCVVRNSNACSFYESKGWEIESTTQDGPMGPFHTYVFNGC